MHGEPLSGRSGMVEPARMAVDTVTCPNCEQTFFYTYCITRNEKDEKAAERLDSHLKGCA